MFQVKAAEYVLARSLESILHVNLFHLEPHAGTEHLHSSAPCTHRLRAMCYIMHMCLWSSLSLILHIGGTGHEIS